MPGPLLPEWLVHYMRKGTRGRMPPSSELRASPRLPKVRLEPVEAPLPPALVLVAHGPIAQPLVDHDHLGAAVARLEPHRHALGVALARAQPPGVDQSPGRGDLLELA